MRRAQLALACLKGDTGEVRNSVGFFAAKRSTRWDRYAKCLHAKQGKTTLLTDVPLPVRVS